MQTLRNIWKQLNPIVIFFVCLIALTFISFFIFDISVNQYNNKQENISLLEFHNWRLYEIGKEYMSAEISGEVANRYENKEIYNDFEIKRLTEDTAKSIEILRGTEAIHQGDTYDFPLGVEYNNFHNINFFSEAGIYNIDTQIFTGSGNFRITNTQGITNGKDILYDKKTDTIIAKDIHSQILNFNPKSN